MTTSEQPALAGEFRDFRASFPQSVWRRLAPWRKRPMGMVGAFLVVLFFFIGMTANTISPYDPGKFVGGQLENPSLTHPLGTNNLGQDVLSRTFYGAQVSIAVGISSALIAVTLGTFFGVVSGYVGGWLDLVLQRFLEIIASFPGLILTLIVIAALGRPTGTGSNVFQYAWALKSIEVAIGIVFIFGNMRVIRSATLSEKNQAYVEAARSIGVSPVRIIRRHILPNVFAYVIIAFSVIIGIAILIEAALSFLGYGVSVLIPSWGADLSARNREYFIQAPWIMAGPGVAITLTVLGFNFLGDALRDILDPRLRGSR